MKTYTCFFATLIAAWPVLGQQAAAPAASPQTTVLKSTVDEVVLDFVARDKKGKPVTDLKAADLSVVDNGAKQQVTSFRLVQGAEAVTESGSVTKLDPLRQLRLVTLAFEAMDEPDQRKRARSAALDLIHGEQGANVFYSVVIINTRLMVLQQFTSDKDALEKAIEQATGGLSAARLLTDSDRIKGDLKRYLNSDSVNTGDQSQTVTQATQMAGQAMPAGGGAGAAAVQAKLASIMLDMLRMDASIATMDARGSLTALESLVRGLQNMPGRKSILYFTWGMYKPPELDLMFNNLMGMANRANVTFYSVDTRGVMTWSQNGGAADQLNAAARAGSGLNAGSGVNANDQRRVVTKEDMKSSDNAEAAGRSNVQLPIRDLAEATGGFLIGDSNDLRTPLRHVNEEIASYYELTYNPHIDNYDGSFRKLKLDSDRKNLVLQARNGYFALPPEARAEGLQAFEIPLLKAISSDQAAHDVEFRAAAFVQRPRAQDTDVSIVVEVPLHGLEAKPDAAQKGFDVHFSLGSLVKDAKGEVSGPRLTRDRSFHVNAEQLKAGNFVEKMPLSLAPGKYSLDTAVLDRESGKVGVERTTFNVPGKGKGVGISSLASVRSYTPDAKNIDPNETFQFQGGLITPTLNNSVPRAENSNLRLFFVVYKDPAITAKPTVEIEFLQNGKSLTKVPLPLPDPDAQGRIPYVMTIPAASIPPGLYEVRAAARQGDSEAVSQTTVKIQAN
jgi:VWFA-related protein